MKVVFYGNEMPDRFSQSIFLAGPSLRPGQEGESWRGDALKILSDKGFEGVVFCPENEDGLFDEEMNYEETVKWEDKYLNVADCVLFWVPRDLSLDDNEQPKLAGLTTNVEWGVWCNSGKVVFGAPENAEKVRYLKHYAKQYNVLIAETLTETIDNALEKIGDGALRVGGERYVPLNIWKTPQFQSWYAAQSDAGNELTSAKVLYTFRSRKKDFIFLTVLMADVYVSSENRHKTNEFVLSRPDISSVLMWKPDEDPLLSEVVIVKEFRSPASTSDGFIRELPGGSSPKEADPEETAAEEVYEETGLYIKPSRLDFQAARQLAGTFSSHKSHLFSVELDDEEMKWLKSQAGIVHGNEEDSERTFIEIFALKELLESKDIDWSTIGMVMSVIFKE